MAITKQDPELRKRSGRGFSQGRKNVRKEFERTYGQMIFSYQLRTIVKIETVTLLVLLG